MAWRSLRLIVAMLLTASSAIAQSTVSKQVPVSKEVLSQTVNLDRRITVRFDRVRLDEALKVIGRAAGVSVSYGSRVVPVERLVSYDRKQVSVRDALKAVLDGTGIDVRVVRDQIILVGPSSPGSSNGSLSGGAVVGRVTDAKTGDSLSRVDVFLDGTSWRTATDSGGRYALVEVDPGAYVLIVRRLGYAKQSRKITLRAGHTDTIDVALEPAAVALNELVTTVTGQQRRREIGNAITTIRADSVLQSAPIRNFTDLLENRVPGMTLQHTSGAPGDPSRIRFRGLGSSLRSNDPVVIVDGIRVYAVQSERRSGNLINMVPRANDSATGDLHAPMNPAPSPLDQIDPNIIDKIEVFKGPSAASLYGADAANGVIVVTTKKGRPGPTRWSARVSYGRTNTLGRYAEAYYNWGSSIYNNSLKFCTLVDLTCKADSLVRFQALNDPALTILGTGHRVAASLTASGGNQALTYSLTGTYGDEIGLLQLPAFEVDRFRARYNRDAPDWMRRPHRLKNWSVTSNVGARLGESADVQLTAALSRSTQQRTSLEQQLTKLSGTYVDMVNGIYYVPKGSSLASSAFGVQSTAEILDAYYRRTIASALNFTTGLNAGWRPAAWFNGNATAGLNVIPRDDDFLRPAGLRSVADSGAVAKGTGRSVVSTFAVRGNVVKPLRWGLTFEASAGTDLTTNHTSDLAVTGVNLVPGTTSVTGARLITVSGQEITTSVFGWYVEPRVVGRRFSLSTGIRLDGGSAYGARITRDGGGLGGLLSLPKLNGSWVISEEPWFPFTSLFSSLRLRGAYGQAQVQPGPADRLRLYSFTSAANPSTVQLDSLGNTELRPERSREIEGGFDADLLESRVSLELTLYNKTKVDALQRMTVAPSVGGGTVLTNIGNIRNTGLEVTLGLTPIRLPQVTWSAQLNYSRNTNTLVQLGRGVASNRERGMVEGYPLGGRWAKPILSFLDINGNGIIDADEIQVGDSSVFLGRLYPDYIAGLHTSLALFNGAIGVTAGFSYEAGATQIDQTATHNWVLARALFDPTSSFAEQAAVLSTLADLGNFTSYGMVQDVSTFRFNSLSINYRVPVRAARFFRAQEMTLAVQGSNLGIKTTYRGKDPNVNSWNPFQSETIADNGQLPMPRTWQLSLYLQY